MLAATASKPPTSRAALSNKGRSLPGVDGRSTAARRFCDLLDAYAATLGGFAGLPEAERAIVRQAAATTLRAEELQARTVRGEAVDPEEMARTGEAARLALAALSDCKPAAA